MQLEKPKPVPLVVGSKGPELPELSEPEPELQELEVSEPTTFRRERWKWNTLVTTNL